MGLPLDVCRSGFSKRSWWGSLTEERRRALEKPNMRSDRRRGWRWRVQGTSVLEHKTQAWKDAGLGDAGNQERRLGERESGMESGRRCSGRIITTSTKSQPLLINLATPPGRNGATSLSSSPAPPRPPQEKKLSLRPTPILPQNR